MLDILNRLNFFTIAATLVLIQFPPIQTVNIPTNLAPILPMGIVTISMLHCRSTRWLVAAVLKVE
ncbi:hypothetical protein [Chamaesiphon sp. GL140_3_metabinner_50]|uniref:hypothetical protein n=1 Tax=Chamaesiphon sp. GL140_3_metabinner_50 TaxID=2970812 RepID=UPI0025F5D947|nr:hypothetical protein [Chamaesiphon sp. GL140_3_metabinner_50]